MFRRQALTAALLAFAALPVAPLARAETGPQSAWAETEQTAVRLIAAVDAAGNADSLPLGLEFKLQKGWKIYWRSPGDAGFPPRPDWTGSDNLASAELRWPAPHRFEILGLQTLGYKEAVVLPIAVKPEHPGEPLRLRAKVDYLTCDDVCIPYTAELALDLPAGPAEPSPYAHQIDQYEDRVPGDGAAHGLSLDKASFSRTGEDTGNLQVTIESAMPLETPDLFVEGPVELIFGKPAFALGDGGKRAVATVPVEGLKYIEGDVAGTPLTLTLADGARAAERELIPASGPPEAPAIAAKTLAAPVPEDPGLPLLTVLGLALLGGLILNLMPCVLPVLSIKLLGIIGQGGRAARDIRLSFLASAAGIIFSFLVIAGGLIALKAAGGAVGWGIQFQQPWFLIAMTIIVTLFACNLWGLFEINLPSGLAGLGPQTGTSHGLAGHFLTGAFATLLATPCSAPFLGTAVGFALARGAGEILWVFAALGVGMALPYLAVAAVPALAARLPRPGPWMVWLKRVLGLALAGTAVWLTAVLTGVVGPLPAGTVAALMVLIAVVLGAGSRFGRQVKAAAGGAVAMLAVAALAIPVTAESHRPAKEGDLNEFWNPFDESAIAAIVTDGKLVFVDVTADWCVTCQVNKTFVLGRDATREKLTAPGVVAMQADWTRPDEDISRYLAKYGRYGIPFNIVYGPGAPDGVVLPELLTEDALAEAFAVAEGS